MKNLSGNFLMKQWKWEYKNQKLQDTTKAVLRGKFIPLNAYSLSELRELVMDMEVWRAAIHGVTKSRIRLSDWTKLNLKCIRKGKRKSLK